MKTNLRLFFIHFFVLVFFVVAALAYFYPVLQGKSIFQSDIAQYTGMAKEQNDFRKETGEEPYWINSAFGGMPTYQLGAYYPNDYVKKLDRVIRFLPRPADYLFLYFIGFYILLCCLKVDYRLAILGALAYGFSTYLIIILGVGHNAKAHALGYLPMLLGGIVLVFRKKYFWGFVLAALAMALEVGANHYQMTYYFMLLVLILGGVYFVNALRKKQLKHFVASVGILIVAVALGIAANATSLMATKEYADWSTRGKSALTLNPDGSPKKDTAGLSKDYITQYSYGITESLDLFVPRLFGGASHGELGKDSKTYGFLINQGLSRSQAQQLCDQITMYWGDQPGVSGPAYIGAVIFFLFILGLFLVKGKSKWWLLGGTLMALFLSWGKNFGLLTDFMIDYFPLYNKFRAVSSIQVILELCAPVLAILALVAIFKSSIEKAKKINALKISFFIITGLCVALLLLKGVFDFVGQGDETYRKYFGNEVLTMIKLDRKAFYTNDLFRSFIYVLLAALSIWMYLKQKIKGNLLILFLGVVIVFDLIGVDRRYVDEDDFVQRKRMEQPFQETVLDKQIAQDTSVYRVYDMSEGLNGARTSYFHHSIGGYHAAKPAGIMDLFDYQIYKNNFRVLDMLNVKYVLQQDKDGKTKPVINPNANGNAWFVKKLVPVKNADQEIFALDSLDVKNEAVVNTNTFTNIHRFDFVIDTTTTIALTSYHPNHLTYKSSNDNAGVAVFSEMYYPDGWNAYIDGKATPHFKVNYVLRALRVPEGKHVIEFKFEPKIIETGSKITLASSSLLALIILAGIIFSVWSPQRKKKKS